MGRVVNNVGEGVLAPLSAAFVVENVWAQADKDPAAFQTQRPDVPVMTPTEVLAKLTKTLSDDPALFLEKYGKFLDHQTLAYFEAEPLSNVYEVKFFATRLRNELAGKRPSAVTMRNRRYRKLQELQTEGEYFTEEAMKERNPALYEHYIGRYLSQEERTVPFSVDSRLSDILLHNYDSDRLKADADNEIAQEQRSHRQAEPDAFEKDDDLMNDEEIAALARLQQRHQSRMYRMDVGQDEEEEEDEEEDKEEDDDDQAPSPPPVNIPVISVAEKEQLRKDFLHLMEQHFLNGQDASFNYAEVDMSEEYDDWQQSNADAADKYFEDEDPDDTPLDEEL